MKLAANNPGALRPIILFTFRGAEGVRFNIARRVNVFVKDADSDPALEPSTPYERPPRRVREPRRKIVPGPRRRSTVRLSSFQKKQVWRRAGIGHMRVRLTNECFLVGRGSVCRR